MHIYRDLLSETMVFQWNFIVVMYAVGVMSSLGYYTRFPTDVSRTLYISVFYVHMSHTARRYVAFLKTGICDRWIKISRLLPRVLQILALFL